MNYFVSCVFLVSSLIAFSQQLRIGVYRDFQMKRIAFAYDEGSYTILADTTNFGSILPNEFIELSVEGNQMRLKLGVIDKGLYSRILLMENNGNSSISLNPKSPVAKQRDYEDDFEITSNGSAMTIVNLVDMDNYLAGVVESEGGGGGHIEYYRVQALISRTYVLKYINRHNKEGFSLCDRVHCQAYHSMLRFTPLIDEAVLSTQNMVLVDKSNKLVDSYFHANCGGQTCEPADVWNNSVPYLNSFIDTFCIYTKQAKWEKRIPKQEWEAYLRKDFNFPLGDSNFVQKMYNFEQPQRKAFYVDPILGIPLRDLRYKFGLRSTFFSCRLENGIVVLNGRGYGHGVGLCQEGAMKMARSGYEYRQIARFYFPGLRVINYHDMNFFKQIGEDDFESQ